MINNVDNENDTALTVVASDNVKELLRSGSVEDIQKVVQEGESAIPAAFSALNWSSGQIIGKYEIVRKIGKGGMGVIYLAKHVQLGILRALKVLPFEKYSANPVFAERFLREARLASQIRHANVIEVVDVETDPQLNISYIVMEYVDGGSLRQALKGQEKLSIEQAIITIQGVASALCVAAERGIVHRDIKPDNIMYTKQGEVKLADLGIAKKEDEDDNLTQTNIMMGTPAYLSPEQVENPKAVDIRSDIYSLGATFYEMLTGQTPYPGKTSYDILRKIFSDPVPDPRALNPEVPGEIAGVVMKMLAKDPDKRYQSPMELLDTLRQMLPGMTETNIQLVVKSIIKVQEDGGGEPTGSNSVFTGTIFGMQRREKRKRFLRNACLVLLIMSICAALAYPVHNYFFAVPKQTSSESAELQPGKERSPEAPAPGVAVPAPLPRAVPAGPPQEKLYRLNIETTPLAAIRLTAADGQIFTYAGNSRGEARISGLKAGEYKLEISLADHYSFTREITIPFAGTFKRHLFPDVKKLTLTGNAGVKIEVHCPDGGIKRVTIPAKGSVQVGDLRKGNYVVKAFHHAYFPVEKRLFVEKDATLALEMEKIFKKFVLKTVPGSQVRLLQNALLKYIGKADKQGECTFLTLKKGVYELQIKAPHRKTHTSVLNVEKDMSVTIILDKESYSVTIFGPQGAEGKMYAGQKLIKSFLLPASGKFVLPGVSPGKYQLTFALEGCQNQRHEINVNENVSLQVNFTALPSASSVPQLVGEGKVQIYLSASQAMLEYIRKNGVEIKIGEGEWTKVKTFPFVGNVRSGKTAVSVRGKGIVPQSNREVTVPREGSTDFLLEVAPQPSRVSFHSNHPEALFTAGARVCKAGVLIPAEPFVEYSVKAASRDRVLEKTYISTQPGEELKVYFYFPPLVHPLQRQYDAGMKLFKAKKYKEALPVLLIAAKGKHLEAVLQVAKIYEQGLGMWFSDRQKAQLWYRAAAELGDPDAAVRIANGIFDGECEGSVEQMLKFYQLGVKAKKADIAYKVAQIYKEGFKSLKPNDTLCLEHLKKAVELGSADAMFDLGIRYERGQGVPFNSKTSLFWIKKAADKGHEQAQKYWKQINQ